MKRYPFLSLKTNNLPYEAELKQAACEVVESGWFLNGKHTAELEEALRLHCGMSYAVACSNGLDALRLIFRAYIELGVMKPGDEVIVPANTYIASVLAVTDNGLVPVMVEPSEQTMNLDVKRVEAAITPRTKAIIPVHLYGQPCDMDTIMTVAKKHNLHVIEDCCQAIGALYKGKMVGTFGEFGCLSFYPTKNLGGMGDGGLIMTNDEKLRDRVVALRNHGGAIRYHHDEIGVNSRLDEIQAAILRVKLPHVKEWNEKRREHAYYYNKLFADCADIQTPKELKDTYCVYHQYTVKIPNRDEVHKMLQENGIGAMLYYPIPLHLQKVHEYLGVGKGSLPVTEKNTELVVSLPMFPEITEEEQRTVAKTLIDCIEKSKSLVKA